MSRLNSVRFAAALAMLAPSAAAQNTDTVSPEITAIADSFTTQAMNACMQNFNSGGAPNSITGFDLERSRLAESDSIQCSLKIGATVDNNSVQTVSVTKDSRLVEEIVQPITCYFLTRDVILGDNNFYAPGYDDRTTQGAVIVVHEGNMQTLRGFSQVYYNGGEINRKSPSAPAVFIRRESGVMYTFNAQALQSGLPTSAVSTDPSIASPDPQAKPPFALPTPATFELLVNVQAAAIDVCRNSALSTPAASAPAPLWHAREP